MSTKYSGVNDTALKSYTGNSLQYPRIDPSTFALECITYEHHEIHAGSHYFIEDYADLAINNVFDMQFTTANTSSRTHMFFSINCESETLWHIYEGATIVTPGTSITPFNNDRNSINTSANNVASITNDSLVDANADTTVAAATLLAEGIVGTGKEGGITDRDREIILKENTTYCFRAIASTAGYINFLVEWYEHTDKE